MKETPEEIQQFQTCHLQKSEILERLREKGCRMTRQREALIDIILQNECACCKEIYYDAAKVIQNIGIATIYRMMNVLEEIGALKWRNGYQICGRGKQVSERIQIKLEDSSQITLEKDELKEVLGKGLEAYGYLKGRKVEEILMSAGEDSV